MNHNIIPADLIYIEHGEEMIEGTAQEDGGGRGEEKKMTAKNCDRYPYSTFIRMIMRRTIISWYDGGLYLALLL